MWRTVCLGSVGKFGSSSYGPVQMGVFVNGSRWRAHGMTKLSVREEVLQMDVEIFHGLSVEISVYMLGDGVMCFVVLS